MHKKYINIFLSIVFIMLGVLLYKSTLGLKGSSIVTTGYYIKFLALCLFASAFIELIKAFLKDQKEKLIFAKDTKRFLLLVFFLIFYVWSIEFLGFILSSFIFLTGTMRVMGYKCLIKSFLISALTIIFIQLLFAYIFEIPLPKSTIFGELEWF